MSAHLLAGKRALDIIEMIGAREGDLSFYDLSTKLDIASANLKRLLKVLIAEDWIFRDKLTKKYSANIRALQLGHSLRNRSSEIISPIISDLAKGAGHSACFEVFRGIALRFWPRQSSEAPIISLMSFRPILIG